MYKEDFHSEFTIFKTLAAFYRLSIWNVHVMFMNLTFI